MTDTTNRFAIIELEHVPGSRILRGREVASSSDQGAAFSMAATLLDDAVGSERELRLAIIERRGER